MPIVRFSADVRVNGSKRCGTVPRIVPPLDAKGYEVLQDDEWISHVKNGSPSRTSFATGCARVHRFPHPCQRHPFLFVSFSPVDHNG